MHTLEPYYAWRNHYIASEDEKSPFYGRTYSEFEYSNRIYDHYIHPQWDTMGSPTLCLKILFVDYEDGYAILELIGEWNDCLHNDIMTLKREVIDLLVAESVVKFVLIGENVLNFHHSDDSYYEEWFEDVSDRDGWIALLNFREHVLQDMQAADLDQFFVSGGEINELAWRTMTPAHFYQRVSDYVTRRIGA